MVGTLCRILYLPPVCRFLSGAAILLEDEGKAASGPSRDRQRLCRGKGVPCEMTGFAAISPLTFRNAMAETTAASRMAVSER
ncbi:hypothetical protein NN6n1_08260 [Shinella zoogloeoides]